MICVRFTPFFSFAWLCSFVLAIPSRQDYQPGLKPRQLKSTSRYARLTKLNSSTHQPSSSLPSHNTIVRPTNQLSQHVIEVHFNNIPRYLLLDTGSADTWMISSDFQCLNSSYAEVPQSDCAFGDPYTGPEIHQTRNETYDQVYGTGEVLFGTFGQAEVTIADLTVQNQKVVLVNRGYGLGDHVRSGVIGLAPRAVTRLFENTNASTSQPNGTVTTYSTIFESMYSHTTYGQDPIAPLFSLALERGEGGGYIAFGGLPPINFTHDFTFTPFKGINYYGSYDPGRYYPIQPQGFSLNGQAEATDYRAIVDSGTAANRLPQDIADRVNAAFNPPATYYPSLDLYVTVCNATVPSFSFSIGDEVFAMSPADMFLPFSSNGLCATSFTRGFEFGSDAYPEGFYVLGDAFLNSVVAVFDVGAGGMWFATHDY